MPAILVLTVIVFVPKVALAPVPGPANVTATPAIGFDKLSVTLARRTLAKVVPMFALCDAPETATTDCGVPGVFVKLNVAGVGIPATQAATL